MNARHERLFAKVLDNWRSRNPAFADYALVSEIHYELAFRRAATREVQAQITWIERFIELWWRDITGQRGVRDLALKRRLIAA